MFNWEKHAILGFNEGDHLMPTPVRETIPSESYIQRAIVALQEFDEFRDNESLSRLCATACWRWDQPLPKTSFDEGAVVKFDDAMTDKLADFLSRVSAFEDDEEDDEKKEEDKDKDKDKSDMSGFSENIARSLGLPRAATQGQILSAIASLKTSTFSAEERAALLGLKEQQELLAFAEQSKPYDLVPGTINDKATQLQNLSLAGGPSAVKMQIQNWDILQKAAASMGVTQRILMSYSEAQDTSSGPAKAKIQAYADANKITFNDALARIANSEPMLFSEYRREASS
jgi:hypothetical protein